MCPRSSVFPSVLFIPLLFFLLCDWPSWRKLLGMSREREEKITNYESDGGKIALLFPLKQENVKEKLSYRFFQYFSVKNMFP